MFGTPWQVKFASSKADEQGLDCVKACVRIQEDLIGEDSNMAVVSFDLLPL